jgi:hypothetical protein
MGENIVTAMGTVRFYNGIDIEFAGNVEVVADAEKVDIGDSEAYNTTYVVETHDGRFAYIATQISSSTPITNIFSRTISDEEYVDMIEGMTARMIGEITQNVPGATVIASDIERTQITAASGTSFDVGVITYTVSGVGRDEGVEIEVRVTTVMDQNNITMIMTMRDGSDWSNTIAESVEGNIRFR